MVNPLDYDHVVVAFSGGKDSTAAFLHLLDRNVPKDRIELWHHDIDGRDGSHLMDWPSTPAYCGAFARAFDAPLYFSWRIGGFEREMLRDSTPTAPVNWENPDGSLGQAGGKGPAGTRLRFPQVSADISVRWCSGYLKIDVGVIALRNQPRFLGKKTLFISGERAEESPCRARYKEFEMDRTSTDKRSVHRWGRSMPGENSRSGKSCGDTVSIRIRPTGSAGAVFPVARAFSARPINGPLSKQSTRLAFLFCRNTSGNSGSPYTGANR